MTENHFAYRCPIVEDAVRFEDCRDRHRLAMQGSPDKIEDKRCALGLVCYMCPVRNAFKIGGVWSKPHSAPHWDEPRATPAELPAPLLKESLAHVPPYDSDYRRVGLWGDQVGIYRDHFAALSQPLYGGGGTGGSTGQTARAGAVRKPKQAAEPAPKTASMESAMAGAETNDLAKTVNRMTKELKEPQSAPRSPVSQETGTGTRKTKDAPAARSQRAPDTSEKLTLAERARRMREQQQKGAA